MLQLAALLVTLLCCGVASATELVRVRVSQFDGSEPAALSSASHPQLFVLEPSIAFAELVATNPAAPVKDDHGPATWFPVMTPRQGLPLMYGEIELRITPVSGLPVAIGGLHFRSEALTAGQPAGFQLEWSRDPARPFLAAIDLERATTATLLLDAPASDEVTTFRWSTANNFTGTPGGPAGFSGVDLVVTTPLCEDAPRDDCEAATRASLFLDAEAGPGGKLAWSWRSDGAVLDALAAPDAAPLFALCLYDERGRVLTSAWGPDLCGSRSCWKQRRHRVRYRNDAVDWGGVAALESKLKQTRHGVSGSLDAAFAFSYPSPALPLPLPAGDVRAQLVRSDGGACFDASFSPPAKKSSEFEFEDSLP